MRLAQNARRCDPALMDRIPKAVSEAEFTLFGVRLRCYVLDDGSRIINAEDMIELFRAMESGNSDPGDMAAFASWQAGMN